MASDQTVPALATDGADTAPESDIEMTSGYRRDQVERALFEIQSEQNLVTGTVAGVVAGAVGAAIWTVVTVVTTLQIGWLAVGIGCLVGAAVRWGGRGTTQVFGIVGAVLALVSVLVGNFVSMMGLWAAELELSYVQMAMQFDYSQTFPIMAASFSPTDLLFYGIAVWEGYRFSIRQITDEEIHERLAEEGAAPARPA